MDESILRKMDTALITPSLFLEIMNDIIKKYSDDEEESHLYMDGLLCETLRSLGYGEGVDVFVEQHKWYA